MKKFIATTLTIISFFMVSMFTACNSNDYISQLEDDDLKAYTLMYNTKDYFDDAGANVLISGSVEAWSGISSYTGYLRIFHAVLSDSGSELITTNYMVAYKGGTGEYTITDLDDALTIFKNGDYNDSVITLTESSISKCKVKDELDTDLINKAWRQK